MSLLSILMNISCKKNDAKRDAGNVTPEDIIRFDNISYGSAGRENLLDVYRPKSANKPLPVIISIHGGGFVYGTKEVYQYYCMSLAQHGFCVINFNYRLAPKSKFPSPVEDTCKVFEWMLANKDEYLFDTENVFTVGDSAGAQLNSQIALMCTNPEYAALFAFKTPQIKLRAIALNCGIYEIDAGNSVSKLFKDYFGKKVDFSDKKYDVVGSITDKYPPTCIMSANGDFLKQFLEPMTKLLESRGVEVFSKIYGDPEQKDLGHVFHVDIKNPVATICNDEQCEFFRKHLA